MQINTTEKVLVPAQKRGRVVISTNPVREREMLDIDGNVIDPRTKRIIRKAENK